MKALKLTRIDIGEGFTAPQFDASRPKPKGASPVWNIRTGLFHNSIGYGQKPTHLRPETDTVTTRNRPTFF